MAAVEGRGRPPDGGAFCFGSVTIPAEMKHLPPGAQPVKCATNGRAVRRGGQVSRCAKPAMLGKLERRLMNMPDAPANAPAGTPVNGTALTWSWWYLLLLLQF